MGWGLGFEVEGRGCEGARVRGCMESAWVFGYCDLVQVGLGFGVWWLVPGVAQGFRDLGHGALVQVGLGRGFSV